MGSDEMGKVALGILGGAALTMGFTTGNAAYLLLGAIAIIAIVVMFAREGKL